LKVAEYAYKPFDKMSKRDICELFDEITVEKFGKNSWVIIGS